MRTRFCLAVGLAIFAPSAQAASCSHEIDRAQAAVDARIDAIAAKDPGVAESRSARLHRQPTPASIAAAERRQRGDARVERALDALSRARAANRRGDVTGCLAAVAQARAAFGD